MKKTILTIFLASGIWSNAYAEDLYDMRVRTKDFVSELGHEYGDAQYFDCEDDWTFAECKANHKNALDAERSKRISNQIGIVKNPAPAYEPTEEELIKYKTDLIAQYEAQLADVEIRISEKTKGDSNPK